MQRRQRASANVAEEWEMEGISMKVEDDELPRHASHLVDHAQP